MKVTITARKFKARESLKDFVKQEIEALKKFNDDIQDAEVILSFQNSSNSIKTAELIIKVPGQTLVAKEESDDFEKSTREAVEKMIIQLKKIKSKKSAYSHDQD